MLSYRHAFHAGNHADVLKHFILVQLLRYLGQKEKPFWYIDTHAGAGCYALDTGYATKNAEFETGIERLWSRQDLPPALAQYVDIVRALNPNGTLRIYPGSPECAIRVMRDQDQMHLFELHRSDQKLLQEHFSTAGRRVRIHDGDGFAGIKALLPPPSRRALTLIDPPYEEKEDYGRVITALQEGLKRFPTGIYAVWYPQLQRDESRKLPERLKRLPANSWLHVSLAVASPSPDGFGMHGSGMFIINPPWTMPSVLKATMPFLVDTLGQDAGAGYSLEHEEA
jgi:23S rRNA (adenine2030-N6)-methyltransferase